jgi:hypothetical protein
MKLALGLACCLVVMIISSENNRIRNTDGKCFCNAMRILKKKFILFPIVCYDSI